MKAIVYQNNDSCKLLMCHHPPACLKLRVPQKHYIWRYCPGTKCIHIAVYMLVVKALKLEDLCVDCCYGSGDTKWFIVYTGIQLDRKGSGASFQATFGIPLLLSSYMMLQVCFFFFSFLIWQWCIFYFSKYLLLLCGKAYALQISLSNLPT